jgi:hypothetical protein
MNRQQFAMKIGVAFLTAIGTLAAGCEGAEAAALRSTPVGVATAALSPTAGPTSMTLVTLRHAGSALCANGCTGPAYWLDGRVVPDERVQAAILALYTYFPEIRSIVDSNIARGTRFHIGRPDNPGAAATYDHTNNVITIDPGQVPWRGDAGSAAALAGLVAHELVHGAQTGSGGDRCDAEVVAYSWQAAAWERLLPRGAGVNPWYDTLVREWKTGRLRALVSSWELYWDVC